MKVTCHSDEVKISEEHCEYGWFSLDEVKDLIEHDLLTPPAAEAFIKKINSIF